MPISNGKDVNNIQSVLFLYIPVPPTLLSSSHSDHSYEGSEPSDELNTAIRRAEFDQMAFCINDDRVVCLSTWKAFDFAVCMYQGMSK